MSLLNQIFAISVARAQVAATGTMEKVASGTSDELGKLVTNFFLQIPLWIAAIVVAILSYGIAIVVRKSIEGKLAQNGIAEEHKEIQIVASRSAFFMVLVVGVTVSLSIVGIDLKPIVAAGAFGLGFALQDIIMNMVSGMFILASRHYTIGDVIKVNGVAGKIEEIQTRATIIKGFDGTRIVVPNAELFKNVVVSKTSNPYRKLSFIMGVDYSADLAQVMELTLAVVKNIPWVLKKPKPKVIFYEWGDYSINFRINVWIDSKGGKMLKVKNAVIMELSKAYNESGLNIPYPIQTIQLDKADQEEISKEEIDKRIATIKNSLKTSGRPAPVAAVVPPVTPTMVPPVTPTVVTSSSPQTGLPTAIETTPNSPGQSWLQEALARQVAAPAAEPANPPSSTEQPVSQPAAETVVTPVLPAAETPAASAPQPSPIATNPPVVTPSAAPPQPAPPLS